MYTVVNRNAYDHEVAVTMAPWMKVTIAVDVIVAVLLVLWEVVLLRRYKKGNDIEISIQ